VVAQAAESKAKADAEAENEQILLAAQKGNAATPKKSWAARMAAAPPPPGTPVGGPSPANNDPSSQVAKFRALDDNNILVVGRGEVVRVRVPNTTPGTTRISWTFCTDTYDIGFGLDFEVANGSGGEGEEGDADIETLAVGFTPPICCCCRCCCHGFAAAAAVAATGVAAAVFAVPPLLSFGQLPAFRYCVRSSSHFEQHGSCVRTSAMCLHTIAAMEFYGRCVPVHGIDVLMRTRTLLLIPPLFLILIICLHTHTCRQWSDETRKRLCAAGRTPMTLRGTGCWSLTIHTQS
jgi:hypothetical protein